MATSTTLTIQGYRDEPVPNRFLRPEGAIDHLALLLPGYGYTLDMPLFYYAEKLLLERGWDVLRVEYAYNTRPEFQTLPKSERDRWLLADTTAAWRAGLGQRA
jgi:predicted alpha/beta-hydrolase family hydrolase